MNKEYEPVNTVVLTMTDWYKVQDAINKRGQDHMAMGRSEQSAELDRIYNLIEQQLEEEE